MKPTTVPAAHRPGILLLEDDPSLRFVLVHFFELWGFHVGVAESLTEARVLFHHETSWARIVTDYHLPDGTGLDFCCWVREQTSAPPRMLLMSGGLRGAPPSLSGVEFLAKPFELAELEAWVRAQPLTVEAVPRCPPAG